MPEYSPLTESYAKIQNWARAHAPSITFRPPAKPADIDNFAAKSGLVIPEDLRQALLVADGETPTSAGMIGNWRILPRRKALSPVWNRMHQLTSAMPGGILAGSPS